MDFTVLAKGIALAGITILFVSHKLDRRYRTWYWRR